MSESRESPLVSFLQKHAEDRAMLAALRRGLGQPAGTVPEMYPYVMPFAQNPYDDWVYLVASLFALHPASVHEGNMGNHLRIFAKNTGNDEAVTRRFVQLLRLRGETLATPLRQHISLLKSGNIGVNWHQFAYDMRFWSHSDYFVQKNWAQAYWA